MLLPSFLFAQGHLYLEAQDSRPWDFYQSNADGYNFKEGKNWYGLYKYGFHLGYKLKKNVFLETGYERKTYLYELKLRTKYPKFDGYQYSDGYTNSGVLFKSKQFPLNLKAKFNLCKNIVFLVPTVGYRYCLNKDSIGLKDFYPHKLDNYSYMELETKFENNGSLSKTGNLIQAGVGLEAKFLKHILLNASANYFFGLKRIFQMVTSYTVADEQTRIAKSHSNGQYANVTFGVGYLFGK